MSSGGKPQRRSKSGSDLIAQMFVTRLNAWSGTARPGCGSLDVVVGRQEVLSHV